MNPPTNVNTKIDLGIAGETPALRETILGEKKDS